MMMYKGVARGKNIELEEAVPFPEGQPVRVSVEPLAAIYVKGSPATVLAASHEPPHVPWEVVDELERAIEVSRLPVRQSGVFNGSS